ncbi:MAG TPA: PHP domain-containing protein [Bryobacteraceae bacterium]|jgi:error-prone DNA polymerase|nr:PHP domain-containing protein [Bryobacteraceae bacterium]
MYEYAELQVSSNFSFLRGASHPQELVAAAHEYGHYAIALTDCNTLSGIVLAHSTLKRIADARTRFIVGCRLNLSNREGILCYPTNRKAYGNLTKLLTLGRRRAEKGECVLELKDVAEYAEGQEFVLPFPQVLTDSARLHIQRCAELFRGNLHLALTHSCRGDDKQWIRTVAGFADSLGIPVVATNNVLYHDPERKMLQDVVTCIREKCTVAEAGFRLDANAERHLKPPNIMAQIFHGWPQALAATVEIADRCRFSLDELRYEYPEEIVEPGLSAFEDLKRRAYAGAKNRYPDGVPEAVIKQIEHELKLIGEREYAPYFLTVHEIVKFSKERGILCQGRGSAANSVICFCLGITEADPVARGLLFERFISAARNEPPDIDVDFEHERREDIIQHIYEKYGRDRAGITATVVHYRQKRAVREVTKVLEITSNTPPERQELAVKLMNQLVGFPRHLSQHVGGFVIARGRLDELVPIENARMQDRTVIQWEKDDIDELGMMKVDVLGLGMLSAIRRTFELMERHYGKKLTLDSFREDDPKVYAMLQNADSIGVFQVESRAQQSMLPRLKPACFYDLVVEVAIVRPGPIQGDMVHPYLRRREGKDPVEYPSPELKAVLEKTLGVPLFQEQAMQIAITGANFTADEADALRRSLATFRHNGMISSFRERFIEGMKKNGYSQEFADRCFGQIEGFGTYGFPEAHAISFANLVYVSAWIKCHYPDVFCAALLNSQPMGFYAPAQLVRDAREHGVEVRPIDVNHSNWETTLEPVNGASRHAVRLGLHMVSGLPKKDAHALVAARGAGYRTPIEVARRAGCGRRALDRLAQADTFDSMALSRRQALWKTSILDGKIPPLFRGADLFEEPEADLPATSGSQEVLADYLATGLTLRDHPVTFLRSRLKARRVTPLAEVKKTLHGKTVLVAGLVLFRQHPMTAKDTIFMTIEDETGAGNLIVWKQVHDKYHQAVYQGKLLACRGVVQREGQVLHVVAREIWDWSAQLKQLDPQQGAPAFPARSRDFR